MKTKKNKDTNQYYKKINGINYNKNLLDKAINKIELTDNKLINTNILKTFLDKLTNGGKITKTEKNTLNYLKKKYKITNNANKILKNILNDPNKNNKNNNNYLMKNYYTDLTGKDLYKKIIDKYNFHLNSSENNSQNNFYKILNFGIIGALLDIDGGNPCHFDSYKNRQNNLPNGLKLFENTKIKKIPNYYYQVKNQLDKEGRMENKLTTNLCINMNQNSNSYGEIIFLGNWDNPIGNNSNCLRELLMAIKNKDLDKNTQNYSNIDNKNLENVVTDLDDDYYSLTDFNNVSIEDRYYKDLEDYLLVIINGKSIREEPRKFNYLNADIYYDKDFFKYIPKKKLFESQYSTRERGYNSIYHLYKYTQ